MTVQTRRGCPLGCSYCSTPAIEGWGIRRRSPEAVAEDLRVQGDAGVAQFYFTDNTFNLPPDYARALCRSIKSLQRNFRWCCILYPGKLDAGWPGSWPKPDARKPASALKAVRKGCSVL